jgi:NADP-dependent 3-hydroxy acid dehydrogenase YdfG
VNNYLEDKVIVVTGAGSGFGRLVCQKAASLGARVVAADISRDTLNETVRAISDNGGEATAVVADVTNRSEMKALASSTTETYGRIDVMINNAGVMPLAFYSDHEAAAAAWERCIDINIKGVLNGITAVHDQMLRQGRGHVVNIASIYGNHPTAGGGVYGATKAAVVFLSESLRVESQGRIKVTIVRPTGIPGTNLSSGIINPQAVTGLLGQNAASAFSKFEAAEVGHLPASHSDINDIEYFMLDPDTLADQIIYAINQPWGVSISDITVRASGDDYIM